MELLDLLGRRWALRVLWELRDEPLRFRALRERCDEISPSVLNSRLAELRQAGIVELDDAVGYRLTPEGRELGSTMIELDVWARRWARAR